MIRVAHWARLFRHPPWPHPARICGAAVCRRTGRCVATRLPSRGIAATTAKASCWRACSAGARGSRQRRLLTLASASGPERTGGPPMRTSAAPRLLPSRAFILAACAAKGARRPSDPREAPARRGGAAASASKSARRSRSRAARCPDVAARARVRGSALEAGRPGHWSSGCYPGSLRGARSRSSCGPAQRSRAADLRTRAPGLSGCAACGVGNRLAEQTGNAAGGCGHPDGRRPWDCAWKKSARPAQQLWGPPSGPSAPPQFPPSAPSARGGAVSSR